MKRAKRIATIALDPEVLKVAVPAYCLPLADLGLSALESQLAREPATGEFCHGGSPTLADCCLVPQLANARRTGIPLDAYPTLTRIEARCNTLAAFATAMPEKQPDAE